jgi:hypothetical protein
LIGALINQTNIYFPRTISAIALPDLQPQSQAIASLRNSIESDPSGASVAMTYWKMGRRKLAVAAVGASLDERGIQGDPAQIEEVLEGLFDAPASALPPGAQPPADPESELLAFRRAEFNIIRNQVNDPANVPNLRVILTTVPPALSPWFVRVNLVERLKETRVFYGFDRLEQSNSSLAGMPDTAMQQLFRHPPAQPNDRWLPAVEVFGEGIYIELHEQRLVEWQNAQAAWIAERIDDGFLARLAGVSRTLPPLSAANRAWASRYLMVHSLAHIMINQLVFECGYSTASLRERLYISADPTAPMAAFMIYTAAGDSEGTLGSDARKGSDRLFNAPWAGPPGARPIRFAPSNSAARDRNLPTWRLATPAFCCRRRHAKPSTKGLIAPWSSGRQRIGNRGSWQLFSRRPMHLVERPAKGLAREWL